MTAGLLSAFPIWCGIWWRMRGGAISNFGFTGGTQATRAVCCTAIVLPLVLLIGWAALALAPLLHIGLMWTQWEEFEDMGAGPPSLELERPGAWVRWLPNAIDGQPGSFGYDMIGMGVAGVVCVAPAAVAAIARGFPGYWLLAAGALFSLAYAFPRWLPFPAVPRFAVDREWAEVLAGVLVGAALLLTALHWGP